MNRKSIPVVSGREILTQRDQLETYFVIHAPIWMKDPLSALLTAITGLAPTARASAPVWQGSEARAAAYMFLLLLGGTSAMIMGGLFWQIVGALALISGMRNFSSSVGHHLTHSTKSLPWNTRWTRLGYDVIGALFLLPEFVVYRDAHGKHHLRVAGAQDPDQQFIEWLGAKMHGPLQFAYTLVDPMIHLRFLVARVKSVLSSGPYWRRTIAFAYFLLMIGTSHQLVWWMALVIGYQAASLMSFASLHLWGNRPEGATPKEVATTVTFGRLLVPAPGLSSFGYLAVYALVRGLWLQGDLNNHDLHHLGKGPWTEAPYVRTRLILSEELLNQTNGVKAMFERSFQGKASAPAVQSSANGEDLLGM